MRNSNNGIAGQFFFKGAVNRETIQEIIDHIKDIWIEHYDSAPHYARFTLDY